MEGTPRRRLIGVGLSLGLHSAMIWPMSAIGKRDVSAKPEVISMRVVERAPEPTPPVPRVLAPQPAVHAEPSALPMGAPRPRSPRRLSAKPPAPRDPPAPTPAESPPPIHTVDVASTSALGTVAVVAVAGPGQALGASSGAPVAEPVALTGDLGSGPQGSGGGARRSGAITRMPELLDEGRNRRPPYPPDARARGIQGKVHLKVFVDEQGAVKDARVLRRLDPSCDEVALRWVRERLRFKPALAGDRPVATWIDVPVHFVIDP